MTKDNWISVEDRLPEPGVIVWIKKFDEVKTLGFLKEKGDRHAHLLSPGWDSTASFTHWKPRILK